MIFEASAMDQEATRCNSQLADAHGEVELEGSRDHIFKIILDTE